MTTVIDWISANPMFCALLALMFLDVLMGLVAAYGAKQLSSSVSWKGMSKKAAEILIVLAALVLEAWVPELVPTLEGLPIASIAVAFYAVTELLSIMENAARIGIPLPGALTDALAKVRQAEGPQPVQE